MLHEPTTSEGALAALPAGPVADFASVVLRRVDLPSAMISDAAAVGRWAAAIQDTFGFLDERRQPVSLRVLPRGGVALDGGTTQGSVVQIACEDREFILTSVTEELRRHGLRATRMLGVPFGSERDATGAVRSVGPARGAAHTEGLIEAELDARLDPGQAESLMEALRSVLAAVFLATDDQDAMRSLTRAAAERTTANAAARFPADEVAESVALVDWLLDGHCVLLGTCRFPLVGGVVGEADVDTSLGLLRDADTALAQPPEAMPDRLLDVTRLPQVSVVHRQVPLERFDLTLVGPDGAVDGIARLVCVFSQRAEASTVQTVPLLRWKLHQILVEEDAVEGSYDEQAVMSLFQALPKDHLFRAGTDELHATIRTLLAEDRDHRVRVLMQAEPGAGAVSVLVTMPSELYTRTLRRRVEEFLLAQLDGDRVDVDLSMGGSSDTVARFLVHLPVGTPVPADLAAVSREVQLLCRTWEQELTSLLRSVDPDRATQLASTWADRLPASYRDAVRPAEALDDVLILDALAAESGTAPALRVRISDVAGGESRLTVAGAGAVVELSRLLPIVESVGLWATDELHWDAGGIGLHHLAVRRSDGAALTEADGPRVCEAVHALWDGRAAVDSLNRLVTVAGMPWADVAVLRAYRRYRRQVDPRFAEAYVDDVLVEHAPIARAISDLFAARFGPQGPDHVAVEARTAELLAACDQVARLDHDRILRGLAGTITATLRTNLHLPPVADGAPLRPLALKLDPALVPDAPEPVPYREIFVHGPTVEGVHLRAGPVARGGLRFSDRPEDYRSEVLDLMRTQVLKNALIVPTGAKGGFVLRGQPGSGVDRATVVRAAYEAFVSSLLDVTDDLRGDDVLATPGRWDGDDPYLVVAADKGTAAFSDVANQIACDRGFWLGDAFASGGSAGYDHRALGITARGAWVAVARHFRELGVDVATDEFTVAGVGDMSGDVFGNGMLLSDQIRLVAAFDHRDVFLDPSPDPATSLAERRRLQQLPGSSWQQFDPAVISPGGGVFSRALKHVPLSEEVRGLLRLTDEALTPAALIQAILRAPVDLLYLGGVGTYVRASTETDASLDDRANSEVRVAARDLRARVVGEGANLGFTQRARIEYARRGGHINMDAIDNSAGVDTSDHEVNIKILLDLAVETGDVTAAERPGVLAEVTDDVVAMVLSDSADQSDALRRAQARSVVALDAFEATQAALVGAGILDATIEVLPDAAEYEARRRAGAGLTRPELAVLLAGAKRQVKAAVLASELPDTPAARDALVGYFPAALADAFRHLLDRHRLRRDLVASEMANDLVDHLGPTVVVELGGPVDLGAADVAAAYWVARGVADGPRRWAALAAVDGELSASRGFDARAELVDGGSVVVDLLTELTRRELLVRRQLLSAGGRHDVGERIADDRSVFEQLEVGLPTLERPDVARARLRREEQLGARLPAELARELSGLPDLAITPDVAELGRDTGSGTSVVAGAFLALSDRLGIDRLRDVVAQVPAEDHWARLARQGLLDDVSDLRRAATRAALDDAGPPSGPDARSAEAGTDAAVGWLATRSEAVAAHQALLAQLDRSLIGVEAATVAVRSLRQVLG